ncbi:PREDICTED: uncharacterized protein LOC106116472 [Papilio xuthus]|uniref:Uncharacterized protein LOC106116472 n=1 Tax=Papilio xuthus TaxID=66420 RepID=A0AAJ6Z5P7_PAPXU|nr:PREDICTED: uncharacterized protein LOC106116472 [Papilio xuthus]
MSTLIGVIRGTTGRLASTTPSSPERPASATSVQASAADRIIDAIRSINIPKGLYRVRKFTKYRNCWRHCLLFPVENNIHIQVCGFTTPKYVGGGGRNLSAREVHACCLLITFLLLFARPSAINIGDVRQHDHLIDTQGNPATSLHTGQDDVPSTGIKSQKDGLHEAPI